MLSLKQDIPTQGDKPSTSCKDTISWKEMFHSYGVKMWLKNYALDTAFLNFLYCLFLLFPL